MMQIEIASNIQTNSVFGDRRASVAAQKRDERQPAHVDARATGVNGDANSLGQASDGMARSAGAETASVQSPAPVGGSMRSSTPDNTLAPTQDDLKEFITMLNELSQMSKNRLEFEFDHAEGISVIRVVDAETGKTVRRIPPEKLLGAIHQFFETLGIAALDETA
ncbi:MAG: hypothetical protein DRH70_07860 [Candidatus Coatesbacteria bacterium]|nr:MAG: hypothetical protein DRH70_07860 [Candidatus Coatesbacteria bacterium]